MELTPITTVLNSAVAIIGRQAGHMLFYKSKFEVLAYQVEELRDERLRIQHMVHVADNNAEEIEAYVLDWLERVDDVIENANRLGEDLHHTKFSCFGLSFPNLMTRHQLSRKATRMAKDIEEVRRKGKFDSISYLPSLRKVGFSYTTGSVKLESRESIQYNILQLLRDPKVSKIGVYGLGGVGKTILVKEVATKAREDKLFDEVVMVTVTRSPDIRRIQGEIAEHLGLKLDEETTIARANRLNFRIKREPILFVLDNIEERLDLEEIGILFGDEHNGCKVLMTTRNQDVLRQMEAQKYFKLEVLSEEETWNLFEAVAGDAFKDPSFRNIATKLAEKCAGLPIFVTTVARKLKTKDIYSWKDALKKLDRPDSRKMPKLAYSTLKLSYDWLKSEEVKAIFLLCGVIREYIVMDDLLKYGVGLGIFKHTHTVEDARNRLYKIIGELKASCLLLEDDKSVQVKMDTIVRILAISIARRDQNVFTIKEGVELKEWPMEINFLESCTQIILDGCYIQEFPERLDCPQLKLLYLNNANNRSLEIPASFFQGMGNLQVLNLKCVNMSSLPTSLLSLIKLKTLCLDQCSLEDMDGVGALKNIEILSIVKSSITKLPSEIGKLINLRMLDLEGSTIEVIPPKILSNLIKLEELYMSNTTIKWEVKNLSDQNKNASLAELGKLNNLAALDIRIPESQMLPKDFMFEKLERYKIVVGDIWGWTDIKYGISRTLMLKLHTSIHSEDGIKVLIERVEDLYLDEIDGISNILPQLDGNGFPLLKYLHIQNNKKIQDIINSVEWTHQAHDSFPNLEKLELHNLSHLDKIYHGPHNVSCFTKLQIIKVKSCNGLRNLFLSSMVEGLSHLLEIEVAECEKLKEIVAVEDTENVYHDIRVEVVEFQRLRSLTLQLLPALLNFYVDEQTSSRAQQMPFFSSKVAFPELETLKLRSLNFKNIWEEDQNFPTYVENLTSLIVENCAQLKYLFSIFMAKSLSHLKQLEISECHMMEEIIKATEEETYNWQWQVVLPKLETLKLSSLSLKKIWGEDQLSATYQLNLTSLIIENCGNLKYLVSSSAIRSLSKLKRLEISKCHMIEEILHATEEGENYAETLFPSLEAIIISDMENLKTIWQWHQQPGPDSFGRLKRMEVRNCKNLVTIFSV